MGTSALKSAIKILEVRIHERELANHEDRDQIRVLAETIQRIESKKQEASRMRPESRGATPKGNHTSETSTRLQSEKLSQIQKVNR